MIFVRRAHSDDLAVSVHLFQGYLSFYGRDHSAAAVSTFLSERLTANDSIIFLALEGSAAVGIAQVYPTFATLSLSPSWVLGDLFVSPAARRTGAGRALLQTVSEEAKRAGAAYVALETAHDNLRAQQLYESEGFEIETEYLHYERPCEG